MFSVIQMNRIRPWQMSVMVVGIGKDFEILVRCIAHGNVEEKNVKVKKEI